MTHVDNCLEALVPHETWRPLIELAAPDRPNLDGH